MAALVDALAAGRFPTEAALAFAREAGRFALLGAALIGIERLRPARRAQRILRPGVPVDLLHNLIDPIMTGACVALAGTAAAALVMLVGDPARGPGAVVRAWPLALQLLVGSLITDFAGYWRHRLTHGRRLWPAHAVHHSSVELDWLSTSRFHPIEQILTVLVQILSLWLLGFSDAAIAGAGTIRGIYGAFIHANLDLRYGVLDRVFVSPRQHRWHHSAEPEARDRNFATLFALWDVAFGTYHCPAERRPERLGLDGETLPNSYLVHIGYPFVKWFGGRVTAERSRTATKESAT
jgi:sterol desaturase/sphingolipid hydroxylase (fatty acid hydroxylase superfamily)